jgi:hypothetical protein
VFTGPIAQKIKAMTSDQELRTLALQTYRIEIRALHRCVNGELVASTKRNSSMMKQFFTTLNNGARQKLLQGFGEHSKAGTLIPGYRAWSIVRIFVHVRTVVARILAMIQTAMDLSRKRQRNVVYLSTNVIVGFSIMFQKTRTN